MPTLSRHHALWLFPVLVAALALTEYWIAHTTAFATHPDLFALVITLDVVVGIPLLGYFFLVRTRRAPATVLVLLFLLAVLVANVILPESGKRYLKGIELVLPLLEIAMFLYVLSRVRKIIRAYRDIRPTSVYATDALEQSLQKVVGNVPAIGIVLTELSLVYYAIGGWFARYAPTHPTYKPFTYHLKSGYGTIAALMIGLSCIEIPLMHLVIHQFSPIGAWILTILTLYTILWLVGDYQAIRLHPIVVEGNTLHLRAGMRWHVTIPLEAITTLRPLHHTERSKKEVLDLSIAGNPRLLLELKNPVTVRGLFGMKRVTDKIAFAVDDDKAFLEAIEALPS
jgi:hypothetical protein